YQHHLPAMGFKASRPLAQEQAARKGVEVTGLHKDGREISLEISFGKFSRAGHTYYTCVVRDIIERKQAEDALRDARDLVEARVIQRTRQLAEANTDLLEQIQQRVQAEDALQALNQELQRSNRELQDFAFVASHDLQEPLRKIQAFGDLLLNQHADALGEE